MRDFDQLSEKEKGQVMEIVANFHYRNGIEQPDGSRGEIKITLKEFNDVLAKVIIERRRFE